MDLDRMLVKRVKQASGSFIGKRLLALTDRIGGAYIPAALNIIFTGALGFLITFPIYELEGFWLALPTGAFTIILLFSLATCIFSSRFNVGRKHARKLLVFAILFSLPFGLLSLPLLHELSRNHKE
ncbi:hypothetical protein GF412_05040 [Candidatus Micrarchaeota archaeon]|nr:hypothetical protein [Candidatus Micrarchaeota archaeon]MBD3418319.1 hypothetical protein [Candidatus Micrarchaeota archaeon]